MDRYANFTPQLKILPMWSNNCRIVLIAVILKEWREEENPYILKQLIFATLYSLRTTCKLKTFPLANEPSLVCLGLLNSGVHYCSRLHLLSHSLFGWGEVSFSYCIECVEWFIITYFPVLAYRAEHHEVLEEYKEGIGKFIGKNLYVLCDVLIWSLEVFLTLWSFINTFIYSVI